VVELQTTPDGWTVTDLELFRRLMDYDPPRPGWYWSMLKADMKSLKIIAIWVVGFGSIALAITTSSWQLLPIGIGLLAFWIWCYFRTVREYRDCHVSTGLIDGLEPHPFPKCVTARARIANGREVPVVLEETLADEGLTDEGQAIVIFIDNPRVQFCGVIGARSASQHAQRASDMPFLS